MGHVRKTASWVTATGTAAMVMLGGSAAEAQVFDPPRSGGPELVDTPGSQGSSQQGTNTSFDNLGFGIYNRISNFSGGGGGGGTQTTFRQPNSSGAGSALTANNALPGNGGALGAFNAAASGLAAGNGSLVNGVWGNVTLNRLSDDTPGLPTEGNTVTGIIGYDRLLWEDRWLLGLGFIVDHSSFSTVYNAGDLDTTSYGVVPYVAWRATDELTLNFIANYSFGSADTTRVTPAGASATGSYDTRRWFLQGGIDYEIIKGNWAFGARTELSYGEESNDGYTESIGNVVGEQTNVLGTWRIGGQVGYTFTLDEAGGGFAEPYVMFGYELDFERTQIRVPVGVAPHANDNDQFNIGGGMNVYIGDNWSANIEGLGAIGRTDIGNWLLSGTLRYQF